MRRLVAVLSALALGATMGAAALGGPASAATQQKKASRAAYTMRTLHFRVVIGANKLGDPKSCDVVGDVYVPRTAKATRKHRVPAILTTNGFGGSKDDQAGVGRYAASHGYVVLSYSGLGFGGSGCKVTIDDPSTDGVAARQLVSYLGGAKGIAFTDAKHTKPAPVLRVVKRDKRNHLGKHQAHDPRVGMVGGSYGGEIQFAAASVDPRIDTIVPMITWNDLSYSLDPNGTDQRTSTSVSTKAPGALKLTWGLLFSTLGVVDGIQHAQDEPTRLFPCPNFATWICPALVTGAATGAFLPTTVTAMRHASVVSYMKKIRIPTLLLQGQGDTLFNLNEAAATYHALRSQGTPVKMVWQSWGHSDSTPAPGELDLDHLKPKKQYETGRIFNWFSHYLKGRKHVSTGPKFAWFRDWVRYSGNAKPAFGTSKSFPVGKARSLYLSGSGLTTNRRGIASGSKKLVTPPLGLPTSFNSLDALGSYVSLPVPEADLPGTSATWTSGRLSSPWKVVGSPKLHLKVAAPLTSSGSPVVNLVLFARVMDVAPNGKASEIHNLIAPIRVPNAKKAFTVTMPAFVHRFATGHRIQLVVSGGSLNYRGGNLPTPVTIATGSTGQVLTLPVTK